MKKILFLLLLLFIAGDEAWAKENPAIWNGKADTKWYKASESEFTITTPEQLAGLAKLVNPTRSDKEPWGNGVLHQGNGQSKRHRQGRRQNHGGDEKKGNL